jgi:hypothetical protein
VADDNQEMGLRYGGKQIYKKRVSLAGQSGRHDCGWQMPLNVLNLK